MVSIQDLPDEIILKVVNYLEIEDLLRCGRVSKRIRKVSHDESLWKKLIVAINSLCANINSYSTENKELQLKLDFVMDENARLINIIRHLDLDTNRN